MNIPELKNILFEIVNLGVHISWKFSLNIYFTHVCTIHDTFGIVLERNSNKCIFYGFNKSHIHKTKAYWYTTHRNCHQEKGSIEISVIDISTKNSDAYWKLNVAKIIKAGY